MILLHLQFAVVAELAYAHDSGSCPLMWVWVQVPSTALKKVYPRGYTFFSAVRP